jgi:endoglucanase
LVIDPPTPSATLDASPAGWVNLQARSDFARGMRDLAARLAPLRRHIWAYDLVNEPHEQRNNVGNLPASQWRNLASELIEAVREGEAAAGVPATEGSWIVFEPGLFPPSVWPSLYGQLVPFADRRVIYSDHYYEPFAFTHQNIPQPGYPKGTLPYTGTVAQARAHLQPLADFASRTGAPFYLGEFGAVVWAGWSPDAGTTRCSACPCAGERWQPRRDANGEPIHDNVNWLRDVMDAADTLGMAWTQHSFRTYHGWDSEVTPLNVTCETHVRHMAGEPDTPAMRLMKRDRGR